MPGEPFTFGYIGTHIPAKGIHDLVRACGLLVGEARLRIWGRARGADTAALEQLAGLSQFGATGRIEWRPEYRNQEIVPAVFNHVDAIVVPAPRTLIQRQLEQRSSQDARLARIRKGVESAAARPPPRRGAAPYVIKARAPRRSAAGRTASRREAAPPAEVGEMYGTSDAARRGDFAGLAASKASPTFWWRCPSGRSAGS